MHNRVSAWLVGAAVGVIFGGIWAMDAVADARAATLAVDVELDGAPAARGRIEVREAGGDLVARGRPGEALRIPAGTYEIRVSCPGTGAARVLRDVKLAPRSIVRRVVRLSGATEP